MTQARIASIHRHGFSAWLSTGRRFDEWGLRSAPHHYASHYANYAACHLAAGISGFTFVEWDESSTPGLDTTAYDIRDGYVFVPDTLGFGLRLEEDVFSAAVKKGFAVTC